MRGCLSLLFEFSGVVLVLSSRVLVMVMLGALVSGWFGAREVVVETSLGARDTLGTTLEDVLFGLGATFLVWCLGKALTWAGRKVNPNPDPGA